MQVWIIGAGSMGLLFGAYMSPHIHTKFVTRRAEQARVLQEKGLHFITHASEHQHLPVQAFHYCQEEHLQTAKAPDLILVTVKQTQLDQALTWIRTSVPEDVPVLFLMNGLGHIELAQARLAHPIYAGSTQNGAVRETDWQVKERGRGKTILGMPSESQMKRSVSSHPVLLSLLDIMQRQGVQLEWTDEIEVTLWQKCIMNACINPLTALFGIRNGLLVEDPDLNLMLYSLYKELHNLVKTVNTGQEEKILKGGALWEDVQEVCRQTHANHSSMLQDVQAGRKTEIESINGYFLRLATEYGMELPVQKMVYTGIQFLQRRAFMSYYN